MADESGNNNKAALRARLMRLDNRMRTLSMREEDFALKREKSASYTSPARSPSPNTESDIHHIQLQQEHQTVSGAKTKPKTVRGIKFKQKEFSDEYSKEDTAKRFTHTLHLHSHSERGVDDGGFEPVPTPLVEADAPSIVLTSGLSDSPSAKENQLEPLTVPGEDSGELEASLEADTDGADADALLAEMRAVLMTYQEMVLVYEGRLREEHDFLLEQNDSVTQEVESTQEELAHVVAESRRVRHSKKRAVSRAISAQYQVETDLEDARSRNARLQQWLVEGREKVQRVLGTMRGLNAQDSRSSLAEESSLASLHSSELSATDSYSLSSSPSLSEAPHSGQQSDSRSEHSTSSSGSEAEVGVPALGVAGVGKDIPQSDISPEPVRGAKKKGCCTIL
eukprot:TRINITY_DN1852_c0_g1_i1.p1 TRINITY_DN1852_c0_g1~~TRINITY_DN1852_c0_g1_i1.p1  ORF type:complete len:395 (+),score=54.23 TRINITY_DN1852_c0_g1_i1:439-1623(+)